MRVKITKQIMYKTIITVVVFWLADFLMHIAGVGESNYYYTLKLVNSLIFSFMWFAIFDNKEFHKKAIYSIIFGTWISFTYLISSYSGLIQFFGVYALYSPPPFVIFGVFLSPFFWWLYHSIVFWAGLEVARKVIKNK